MSAEGDRDVLTKLATVVWGPYGSNGLSKKSAEHSQQIGELYASDDALRRDLDTRMRDFEARVNDKLDGLYKLIATLIVSILVGAGGIVTTLVVTA